MHLSKMLIPCKCRFTAPQQNVQLLLAFQQPTGSEKTMTINSLQDAVVQRRSLIKCECLPKSWSQLNVGGRAIRFGVCENFPADGTCGNRQTKPEFERERGAGSKLSSVRKKIEIQQKNAFHGIGSLCKCWNNAIPMRPSLHLVPVEFVSPSTGWPCFFRGGRHGQTFKL